MNLYRKFLLPLCIMFGCIAAPTKSFAFDYKTYSKERHQLRSLSTTVENGASFQPSKTKKNKSKIVKDLTQKILEALSSDLVPAKMFETSNGFSIYFKPAKISKIGVTYKF